MERRYWTYILASQRNGTLYVGVTNDLAARMTQHREGTGSAFTAKYGVHALVHAEPYGQIEEAIAREKQLKKWNRAWKVELIEEPNPNWVDVFERLNA